MNDTLRNNFDTISLSLNVHDTINLCESNRIATMVCNDPSYWKRKAIHNYDFDLNCIEASRSLALSHKYFLLEKLMLLPLNDPLLVHAHNLYFWNKKYQYIFGIPDLVNNQPNQRSEVNIWEYTTANLLYHIPTQGISWSIIGTLIQTLGEPFINMVSKYGINILLTRKKVLLPQYEQLAINKLLHVVKSITNDNYDDLHMSESYDFVMEKVFQSLVIQKYKQRDTPEYNSILFLLKQVIPFVEPNWYFLVADDYQSEHNKPIPKKERARYISLYRIGILRYILLDIRGEKLNKTPELSSFLKSINELLEEWTVTLTAKYAGQVASNYHILKEWRRK